MLKRNRLKILPLAALLGAGYLGTFSQFNSQFTIDPIFRSYTALIPVQLALAFYFLFIHKRQPSPQPKFDRTPNPNDSCD